MKMLLISVPHSGTHFVRYHLLKGFGSTLHAEHIWPGREHDLATMARKRPTIIPLRHPVSVAQSWKDRGNQAKKLGELRDFWARLIEYIDPHNPNYLPLDSPARAMYLDDFNNRHGYGLTTDWPIVRHPDGSDSCPDYKREPLTKGEMNVALKVFMEFSQFFSRWYNPLPYDALE